MRVEVQRNTHLSPDLLAIKFLFIPDSDMDKSILFDLIIDIELNPSNGLSYETVYTGESAKLVVFFPQYIQNGVVYDAVFGIFNSVCTDFTQIVSGRYAL